MPVLEPIPQVLWNQSNMKLSGNCIFLGTKLRHKSSDIDNVVHSEYMYWVVGPIGIYVTDATLKQFQSVSFGSGSTYGWYLLLPKQP